MEKLRRLSGRIHREGLTRLKRKIVTNNDQRWVLISVRVLSEENRSMGPYLGGEWVHS
jgi:hypothetical protein